jgi:hypothetical protein
MRAVFAAVLVCASLTIAPSWAQNASFPHGVRQGHAPGASAPTPADNEMQRRAAKQRNQERFAKIKKDTDQLLDLATQLKKSVDDANDQTLSLEVIRKAEQIEKLAKQVRQKMAGE